MSWCLCVVIKNSKVCRADIEYVSSLAILHFYIIFMGGARRWFDGWYMSAWLRITSPDRGHCVEFLGKTLYSHSASRYPGVSCKKLNTEENSKTFMINVDIWPINLQGACALNHIVSDYDSSLTRSVLSSLRCFKLDADLTCRADMWSHFGKAIIPDPDEGET